ncbi:ferredoxin [Phytohabitans suffuscus]|uniref:Ferredoxin n=1 Tax=Phytohabitans suffuscus TaxID=624315 RepID=A0A6F8YS19_9ACTN|nr:ferredoxin [Phytohabitans suffuscus]
MTYVITDACVDVNDRNCLTQCPVDCIYEGDRMLYIHPDECIDCGACEPLCPVNAIFYEDDLHGDGRAYLTVAAEFFAQTGLAGGASDTSPAGQDHPLVAALPAAATE